MKESDELASILSAVFDDIQRKFTSNVKNEFMVNIRTFQISIYRRLHYQVVVMPVLQALPVVVIADAGVSLMEGLRTEMLRLVGNLMSNNLQCTLGERKVTVWRTAFGHNVTGALRYILAQVCG